MQIQSMYLMAVEASYEYSDASVSDSAAPNLDSALPNLTLRHFQHGYVALILSNTDFKMCIKGQLGEPRTGAAMPQVQIRSVESDIEAFCTCIFKGPYHYLIPRHR